MLRVVIDTNIWIRILLRGPLTRPILEAWEAGRFQLITSRPLLDEFDRVYQRPRFRHKINVEQATRLRRQIIARGEMAELTTTPPRCRDPKDAPVLATAIDGRADAIVSGDSDLRGDDELRAAMMGYGVQLWGVEAFLGALEQSGE